MNRAEIGRISRRIGQVRTKTRLPETHFTTAIGLISYFPTAVPDPVTVDIVSFDSSSAMVLLYRVILEAAQLFKRYTRSSDATWNQSWSGSDGFCRNELVNWKPQTRRGDRASTC